MIFNGIDLNPYFRIKAIRGRGLVNRYINAVSVQGMDGEHMTSIENPAKVLEVDIRIISEDLRQTIDGLNEILATEEPVPIIFPDEPDKTYYGTVETTEETGERVHLGSHDTTIFIRRSDPFKYGPELTATFPTDAVTVTNHGTAEADPIFEMAVIQPVTFAMIQNQNNEYMMLGKPIDVDSIAVEEYELIKHDTMSTTTGWTVASEIDGGVIRGQMVSQGNRFVASSFGETYQGWHGPALKTSLSETLQDFRVDTLVENMNATGVGRVEIYLLDVNNKAIGKMAMKDMSIGVASNFGEIRAGGLVDGEYIIAESPSNVWNNFDGILRIERIGKDWLAHIGKIRADGTHHARRTIRFTDAEGKYMQRVAQIQVHIGISRGRTPTQMSVKDIKVWKVNNLDDNEVPYIAHPGDVITFDHKDDELLINGEDRKDLKDFGGTYFKLKKGQNQLVVHPSNSFNTSIRYRERYR